MTADYTHDEMIACIVSRNIRDGQPAFVGAALPSIRAGTILGHLMHGPNVRLLVSMTSTNLYDQPVIDRFSYVTDWRGARWAEHYRVVEDIFAGMRKIRKWEGFVVGALQVDRYGNSNLLGLSDGNGGFKLRGAGSVGTPSVTAVAKSFNILVNRHDTRTFVERCDFVSCPGWIDGSDGARDALGLLGGPQLCLTPKALLDFDDHRRMRLMSVHPGHTVDEVVEATGFELVIPDTVPTTDPPSDEELEVLRSRIDRHGELRTERTKS
jgi:glutaconate CoA-transferase subunit B